MKSTNSNTTNSEPGLHVEGWTTGAVSTSHVWFGLRDQYVVYAR